MSEVCKHCGQKLKGPRGRPKSIPVKEVLAMKKAKVPIRIIAKKLGISQSSVEKCKEDGSDE